MKALAVFLIIVGLTLITVGFWIKSENYQMKYNRCIEVVRLYNKALK
jgi:hypothetical protein